MTKACEALLELRELIWTAMQSTRDALDESYGSSTLRDRMSDILKTVPTLEDFTLIIRRGTGGKAEGI